MSREASRLKAALYRGVKAGRQGAGAEYNENIYGWISEAGKADDAKLERQGLVDNGSYWWFGGRGGSDMMEIRLGEDEAGIGGQDGDRLEEGGPDGLVLLWESTYWYRMMCLSAGWPYQMCLYLWHSARDRQCCLHTHLLKVGFSCSDTVKNPKEADGGL